MFKEKFYKLIFLVFVTFSFVFANAETNEGILQEIIGIAEPAGITCTDTDATPSIPNGINIRLRGTAREMQEDTATTTRTDQCISGTVLREYFCQSSHIQSQQITCPQGYPCTNGACNPIEPTCGNGIIESGEQCDGTNFGGQTCQSLGFTGGGTLQCSIGPNGCQFNTSQCIFSLCGNGICNIDENPISCPEDCTNANQIVLKENKGYPYNPNQTSNFSWNIEFGFSDTNSNCDSNSLCSITIFNDGRQWKDGNGTQISPPLYVPSQALTSQGLSGRNFATFLDDVDMNVPGFLFFEYRNTGFETNEQTVVQKIISNYLEYFDSNNVFHSIPFYVQFRKDADSNFLFDSRTIYFRSSSADYLDWDGNVTLSMAPIPNSTPSDFIVNASDGRRTMYWNDANIQTDPAFVNLKGADDRLYRYRLWPDSHPTSDLYLILDSENSFEGKFDADIRFLGTDINEDGNIDLPYYWVNYIDFGGGIAGQYFIATFEFETGGNYTLGAEPTADFDTQVFVDTHPGVGILPSFPNTNLDFYTADAKYNPSGTDGPVSFNMDVVTTTPHPQSAYNDWGSKFLIDGSLNFSVTVPDNARHGVFNLLKWGENTTFISSETVGTNNFSSFSEQKEYNFSIDYTQIPSLLNITTTITINNVDSNRTFTETIEGSFDQLFDYTANGTVADLEGIIQTGDMKYKVYFGEGIPTNFQDTGNEDNIIIPFFGNYWRIVSVGLDANQTHTIVLEPT